MIKLLNASTSFSVVQFCVVIPVAIISIYAGASKTVRFDLDCTTLLPTHSVVCKQVFNATNGTVKQDLRPHIVTQIIRIKPKTCIGNCALRVEFFGWYEGKI
jgi:hypothetical protein